MLQSKACTIHDIAVFLKAYLLSYLSLSASFSSCVNFYVLAVLNLIHPALVFCRGCVSEQVSINQKGINKKLYSHQK